MKYMGRVWLGLIVLWGCLLFTRSAQSESMPTSGTFKGFYHKYRDGQARFEGFIVPEKFQAQFAPHDGKYIEVEVKKATSQWGRGRGGTIEELGKIMVLPQAPVKIHAQLRPPVSGAADTVDVFSQFENTGKEPLTISHGPLISGPPGTGGPTIGTYLCGDSNGGRTTLAPGQTLPCVALGWKLGSAPGEIELSADTSMGPMKAWLAFEVDDRGRVVTTPPPPSHLSLTGRVVRREHEDLYIALGITNEGNPVRTIYVAQRRTSGWQYGGTVLEKGESCVPGRIQAFDEHGKAIEITSGPYWSEGQWERQEVSDQGMELRFRLAHNDLFETRAIRMIAIFLLTDQGLELFEVPIKEDLTVPTALPEFGPAVDGHKIRIRMAKSRFGHDEVVRWYLQGVDDKRRNDMFWVDKGQLTKSVKILIDGKLVVDDRNHGFSEEHVNPFPFQRAMSVVPHGQWEAGTHTVEVILDGQGGVYTTPDGIVQWRKFDKPMRSNTCTFEVR